MPRATSDRFSRMHAASASTSKSKDTQGKDKDSGNRATNPLFNTARFGQHILKNPTIAQNIVDRASLQPTSHVLEIGPGTGNISLRILQQIPHGRLTAIEADPRMAAELLKRVQATDGINPKHLEIVIGDAVKAATIAKWPKVFDAAISNTPYQISSPLLFALLAHSPPPRVCVLTFQREFALRLVASPGSPLWSRLSATVQFASKTSLVGHISKNSFRPPPKVESSIVKVEPFVEGVNGPTKEMKDAFGGLCRIIFSRPNRTVKGNFFNARGVVGVCEANWKRGKAAAPVSSTMDFDEEEEASGAKSDDSDVDEEDEEMDVSPDGQPTKYKTPKEGSPEFRALLLDTLIASGHAENRANKMGVDDILVVMDGLAKAGIWVG
jgi:18S rRNA (adenine1779-N6/adenine1780-N6)-dimethyltransferase